MMFQETIDSYVSPGGKMSPTRRPTFSKRQKEQKRRDKQRKKVERRDARDAERKKINKEDLPADHDIAHIIPGPQPLPWETEE